MPVTPPASDIDLCEVARLRAALAQRDAELSIIQDLQAGLLAQTPLPALVARVGEALRAALWVSDLRIYQLDPHRPLVHALYVYADGQCQILAPAPRVVSSELDQLLRARSPLRLARQDATIVNPRTSEARRGALLAVPILGGEDIYGAIVLEHPAQDDPYGADEVRLLVGVAASLAAAIEQTQWLATNQAALGQQAASANILAALNATPEVAQPVLDAIVQAAARSFAPCEVVLNVKQGECLQLVAWAGPTSADRWKNIRAQYPLQFDPQTTATARAMSERRVIEILDPQTNTAARDPVLRAEGVQYAVIAPLLRGRLAIGGLAIVSQNADFRLAAGQMALLTTCAAQAALALGNARLFEVAQRATDRQAASAGILATIAESPTDLQPVFAKIMDCCQQLFGCTNLAIFTLDEDQLLHRPAWRGPAFGQIAALFPRPVAGSFTEQLITLGRAVQVPDFRELREPSASLREVAAILGNDWSCVGAPLLSGGIGLGAIVMANQPPKPLDDQEVALLGSFCDQAAIAIANVRLLKATTDALARQTATAEILNVMAGSPSDVQPVLDAIAEHARVLCGAAVGAVTRFDGEWLHMASYQGASPAAEAAVRAVFPVRPENGTVMARAILCKVPAQVPDIYLDPHYELTGPIGSGGLRRMLGVPMLHQG